MESGSDRNSNAQQIQRVYLCVRVCVYACMRAYASGVAQQIQRRQREGECVTTSCERDAKEMRTRCERDANEMRKETY